MAETCSRVGCAPEYPLQRLIDIETGETCPNVRRVSPERLWESEIRLAAQRGEFASEDNGERFYACSASARTNEWPFWLVFDRKTRKRVAGLCTPLEAKAIARRLNSAAGEGGA